MSNPMNLRDDDDGLKPPRLQPIGAAIDDEALACGVGGGVGGEKVHTAGDILRRAGSTQRNRRRRLGHGVRIDL